MKHLNVQYVDETTWEYQHVSLQSEEERQLQGQKLNQQIPYCVVSQLHLM